MKPDRRERVAWAGLIVWSGLITAVTYGAAVQLPFFFDDFAHIPVVEAHSLTELWQTAGGLAYYRPLAFTLWKIMQLVLGYHSPVAQHTLNLLLHTCNGLLVAWLAGQLWSARSPDWRRRYLSATLFLLYPFSYQAIPWVGSLAHPLVTALILLALASYLKWRATGVRAWAALGLVAAVLAPFAHENGALVGPFIAAIELTRSQRIEPVWRALRRAVVWMIPAVLWLPIWWLVPKGVSDAVALNTGEPLLQNTIYFAQGLGYPFTWLGGWLRDSLGANDLLAAAGLSALALAGAAAMQWRTRSDRRALLPWLWYALAALPAILFLRFDYVINGPRLLLLGAVGAAWLWTDVLIRLFDWSGAAIASRARIALAVGLGFILITQNFSFVRTRMDLHTLGGSVIRQTVSRTMAANAVGRSAIFINLPAWLAPLQSTYAIGHEGVQFLPGYTSPATLVSVNTGEPAELNVFRFEAIRPSMPYLFGLRGQAPDWPALTQRGGQVFVTQYSPSTIALQPAGELTLTMANADPLARFGDAVTLLEARATISATHLQLDLVWQVHEPPSPDVTLFVHVLDARGQLIAQADGDPLAGSYPFWQWAPETVIRDQRSIDVSGLGLALRVGLYDRATGERLPAVSDAGEAWVDDAVAISVQPLRDAAAGSN
ncbi:MAG TPA: hypothetical protein VJG32_23950 [Anaerolineae bacterium]|nr:hypothetical protein [Anaerolineae bacterium]